MGDQRGDRGLNAMNGEALCDPTPPPFEKKWKLQTIRKTQKRYENKNKDISRRSLCKSAIDISLA